MAGISTPMNQQTPASANSRPETRALGGADQPKPARTASTTIGTLAAWLVPALSIALSVGCHTQVQTLEVGRQAPDCSLASLTGEEVALADLTGQAGDDAVLLAFWATWCTNCKAETPVLNALREQ